ncbi:TonB-dependent receptor, partial [Candidatus Latescibacterota bacterium]
MEALTLTRGGSHRSDRDWAGHIALGVMVCLVFGLAGTPLHGHPDASLSGTVHDAETGLPLEGVIVELPETGHVATSDARGAFRISGLEMGMHLLVARRVGYHLSRTQVAAVEHGVALVRLELQSDPLALGSVLVEADRASLSVTSSRPVREFDLRTRPSGTASQLLEATPGLFVAGQGGMADQIFLRGFDSGFGTDVALSVDGMPVNLVSHGHGHGYADLHFLIPEVVGRVEVAKGPYAAEYGNLANAGHLAFHTRKHLHENVLRVEAGSFGAARLTALYQLPAEDGRHSAYVAADYYGADGPFENPEDLRRLTLFAKVHRALAPETSVTLDVGGFSSSWNASGLIPHRAVAGGAVSRWGAVDSLQGGSTSRVNLNLSYRTGSTEDGNATFEAQAYISNIDLQLCTDFTYFRQDGIFGDMVEQADHRLVTGLNATVRRGLRLGPIPVAASGGGGLRADDIDLSTWQVISRRRYWPLLEARVNERNLYLWSRGEVSLTPNLRLVLGLREDLFTYRVDDALEPTPDYVLPLSEWLKALRASSKPAHIDLVQPHVSGLADQSITSPKATLVYSRPAGVDLFANFGLGFHSNDARTVIISQFIQGQSQVLEDMGARPEEIRTILDTLNLRVDRAKVTALPRSVGAEIGLRWRLSRQGASSAPPYHRLGPVISHYPTGTYFPTPPLR